MYTLMRDTTYWVLKEERPQHIVLLMGENMDGTVEGKTTILDKVQKRDGSLAAFDSQKITDAIFAAAQSVGGTDHDRAIYLSEQVVSQLVAQGTSVPTVEEIQDTVERVLIKEGHVQTVKAFILYRARRATRRETVGTSNEELRTNEVLKSMFDYKGKFASLVGYERVATYKRLLFSLRRKQQSGEIPVHPTNQYLGDTEAGDNDLAFNIYKDKYFLKDLKGSLIEKRPEDTFARLAAFMAAMEVTPEKQDFWAKTFYSALYHGHFLPGGRVIAGAGDLFRMKTLANCFVSVLKGDDIESIYQAAYECARTYSYGGGIGVDISVLRPRDAVVHNAATSSTGSVSFMELYSLTTGLIGQEGRRGALMITTDVKHPDCLQFIDVKRTPNWVTNQTTEYCKWSGKFDDEQLSYVQKYVAENTQVRFANISLKVTDEFMQAVVEQKEFGPDTLLIYSKDPSVESKHASLTAKNHYSKGIPSKPIEKYQLLGSFATLEEANVFLNKEGIHLTTEFLKERDIFGDCLLNTADKEFAIRYAGDFMLYYASSIAGERKQLVKAREVWNKFVEGNYRTAEPGLIFWSRMSRYSPSNYVGRPIASTNPCAEVPLEDGGACNLGSLNLSTFVKKGYTDAAEIDWHELAKVTQVLVRFLDNVVSWNESLNALEKQRVAAAETRRLGLGVMGIADMLNQLGVAYDSEEGIAIIKKVAQIIANAAYVSSAELAEEKGASPIFNYEEYSRCPFFKEALAESTQTLIRQKGLRNIALLAIAPTGTLSNTVLGYTSGNKNYLGVSSGIEPIFSLSYTRRAESLDKQFYKVFHPTVQAYIDEKGLSEKAQAAEKLEDVLPSFFFRTAHNIEPAMRIRIQGTFQEFIDHSISGTVNLPEDISPEAISDIYLDAWKHNLKGITTYRHGSRYPILLVEGEQTDFQKYKDAEFVFTVDGQEVSHKGDDVVLLPDGQLASAYEAAKHALLPVARLPKEFVQETQPQPKLLDAEQQEKSQSMLLADGKSTLSECSQCGGNTLKMENGCFTCVNEECGFSKCDI